MSRRYALEFAPKALRALQKRTVIATANLTPLLCPGPWSVDAAKTFVPLSQKAHALAARAAQP